MLITVIHIHENGVMSQRVLYQTLLVERACHFRNPAAGLSGFAQHVSDIPSALAPARVLEGSGKSCGRCEPTGMSGFVSRAGSGPLPAGPFPHAEALAPLGCRQMYRPGGQVHPWHPPTYCGVQLARLYMKMSEERQFEGVQFRQQKDSF